jgi:3-oxoacyl-[acyl-carrier protein] reductase
MAELDFSGRRVLVVGGSSGIGNGIANAFAGHGAEVHVWGTRPSAESYGPADGSKLDGMTYSCVDVADRAQIDAYLAPFESLDVLVLSQGTVIYQRAEFERDGWDRVMAVNLDSLMACAMRFKTALAKAGGSMIVLSSVAGFRSTRGNPAYAASKAAAVSLTRTLGEAWARDGIRVNGIAPGLVDTKITKVTTEHPERLKWALATIPAGRLGTPDDMAGVALFLASPLAGYVYGQTIVVDGGMILA